MNKIFVIFLLLYILQTASSREDFGRDKKLPPIVIIPGLMSSRLISWKHKTCKGLPLQINDIVWMNLQKIIETITIGNRCWLECLKLNKNGTDGDTCKLRADEGLGAIGELSPGNLYTPQSTIVFSYFTKFLSVNYGYDVNSLISMPYDWRMAPIQMENRDAYFSILKMRIEIAVKRAQRPAIIVAHSMGNQIFDYFMDWLKISFPGLDSVVWIQKHIWTYVGMSAPLLGAPGALRSVLSGSTMGLPITEAQARDIEVTFPSTHLCSPRSSRSVLSSEKRSPGNSTTSASTNSGDGRRRARSGGARFSFDFDYKEKFITVLRHGGLADLKFGVEEVESGEIYRTLANLLGDELLEDKVSTLRDLYQKDPHQPLRKLYKRPPVKHVLMVYGVDLPTEIGYIYSYRNKHSPNVPRSRQDPPDVTSENTSESSASASHPISLELNEVIFEEPCGSASASDVATSTRLADLYSPPTCPSPTELTTYAAHNLEGICVTAPEVSTDRPKSVLEMESILCQMGHCDADHSEPVAGVVGAGGRSDGGDGVAALGHQERVRGRGRRRKALGTQCISEIYDVRTKTNIMEKKRKFRRLGELPHTGDMSVPYGSLSFAHTWLDQQCDPRNSALNESALGPTKCTKKYEYKPQRMHRHILDGWAPTKKLASAVATYDPAVELFHSKSQDGYHSTTVMEVDGEEHQEILKSSFVHKLIFDWIFRNFEKDEDLLSSWLSDIDSPPTHSPVNLRQNEDTYQTMSNKEDFQQINRETIAIVSHYIENKTNNSTENNDTSAQLSSFVVKKKLFITGSFDLLIEYLSSTCLFLFKNVLRIFSTIKIIVSGENLSFGG